MKVYFFPPTSPYNPYIDDIVKGLENNGAIVVNKSDKSKYDRLFSSFRAMLRHTDIYHFNWIENKSSKDTLKNRCLCAFIICWFSLIKLFGGKLAWTMHNRESHFVDADKSFHHRFIGKMISKMDMILVHAGETKRILEQEYGYPSERICFVPHGSYVDSSNMPPIYEQHKNFTILAFGLVMRYKNVPLLIKAFKDLNLENSELLIYGKLDDNDKALEREIDEELTGSSNVSFVNAFIPEDEVDDLFKKADICVFPYNKDSMMNSGAVVKAFSEGRPIIASLFGTIKDISDKEFVYHYDYTDETNHLDSLKAAIKDTYEVWNGDRALLAEQGRQAYEYAKTELSWDKICKDVVAKYKEIVKA